jgi:hypothetical protein
MTIKHTSFENVIPLEICNHIKDFFETRTDLHLWKENNPNVIKINNPWKHLKDILEPVFSKYFKPYKGEGGNIYKHTNIYTTHVDSFENYQMINALLPIYLPESNNPQHFVVFDQWVNNGFGRTWYGDRDDISEHGDFDLNKKTSLIPYTDESVYGLTDCDIDEDFYRKYLDAPFHKPKYFKGLTGTAYKFVPGNLILFNSNQLHTTGNLNVDWKLGLHINFVGSLEELLND